MLEGQFQSGDFDGDFPLTWGDPFEACKIALESPYNKL